MLRRLHGNSKVNKDLIYLPEEFAKLDIEGKQLPYEKQDLELVMPGKIKKND
jgi:hypothetical protein